MGYFIHCIAIKPSRIASANFWVEISIGEYLRKAEEEKSLLSVLEIRERGDSTLGGNLSRLA